MFQQVFFTLNTAPPEKNDSKLIIYILDTQYLHGAVMGTVEMKRKIQ